MNASQIISDSMSLDEKLEAIDKAMREATEQAKEKAKQLGQVFAPIDPSQLTICDGCE